MALDEVPALGRARSLGASVNGLHAGSLPAKKAPGGTGGFVIVYSNKIPGY
ncbi:hypothetical protein M2103_000284 [Ereboglobus sp. PH5-5]|nr:hypothetical protein [Ereboglobus sp. PH5-5]